MADPTDARNVLLNRLADEFAARHRAGERPRLEDYCDRHPDLASDIRSLFPALVELERAGADAGAALAVEAADPSPVTELGDFRLLREVGRGGMGVVYEAEQVSLGRRVAIKLLPAGVFRDPAKRKRFEREARAAAKLHHTNIVPVHGFGEHAGTPYYVMQFIPGLGLDAVIDELARPPAGRPAPGPTRPPADGRLDGLSVTLARSLMGGAGATASGWEPAADDAVTMTAAGGLAAAPTPAPGPGPAASASVSASDLRLPGQSGSAGAGRAGRSETYWQSVARIGVQVAGALAYAHKLGVLHRDIKPSNLLLDLDGTVWVTDFGLAKADDSEDLTHTGDILGTLRYMPPEAFEGKADARSDIYALGLTLFELVALRPAYDERDRNKLVKQVTTGDPPRLRRLRPDALRDLVTVVEKAIEKDPARRYPTAGALADDLQRFLDGRTITARRASKLETLWMWSRRRPAVAGLVAAVFLSLLAGAVVSAAFAVRADGFARDAAIREKDATSARDAARRNADDAEAARDDAKKREGEALAARDDAKQARNAAARQAAGLLFDKGIEDARGGEPARALHLFVQALKALPPGDPEAASLERVIRMNIAAWAETVPALEQIWPGGPWAVSGMAISPDEAKVVFAVGPNEIQCFRTDTGRPVGPPARLSGRAGHPTFAADGRSVWVETPARPGLVLDGCAVHRIDPESGRPVQSPIPTGGPVQQLIPTPDGRYLVGAVNGLHPTDHGPAADGAGTRKWRTAAIVTWEAGTGRVVRTVPVNADHFFIYMGLSPGGKVVNVWVAREGNTSEGLTFTVDGDEAPVRLGLHPCGDRSKAVLHFLADMRAGLVVKDGHVYRWSVEQPGELGPAAPAPFRAVHYGPSPDGRSVVSRGDGRAYDVATWPPRPSGVRPAHPGWDRIDFTMVQHSRDQTFLATWVNGAGYDRRLWRLPRQHSRPPLPPAESARLPERTNFFNRACVGPGGATALLWQDDYSRRTEAAHDVRFVDLTTGAVRGPAERHTESVRAAVFSTDGRYFATGGNDGTARVWESATGRPAGPVLRHPNYVDALAFSPDGNTLAAGDYGPAGRVELWDWRTGRRSRPALAHDDIVSQVAFSPGGRHLVSVTNGNWSKNRRFWVWEVETGKLVRHLEHGRTWSGAVGFRPDGAVFLARTSEGLLSLWEVTSGRLLGRRDLDGMGVNQFSPDGRVVAAADARGVRLLDAATLAPLPGGHLPHPDLVRDVAFSPDGAFLITARRDGSAQLWDVAARKPVGPPAVLIGPTLAVAFTPDGRTCVCVGADGTVRRWPVPAPFAEPDLARLADRVALMAGQRMDDAQGLDYVPADEWRALRGRLVGDGSTALVPPRPAAEWHDARAADAEQDRDAHGAEWHLDRLAALRPDDWTVAARRGRVLTTVGRHAEAAAAYAEAACLAPSRAVVSDWLRAAALDDLMTGRAGAGLWSLDRARELTPEDWTLYAARSQLSDPARMVAELDEAVRRGADANLLAREASRAARNGNWVRAAALCTGLVRDPASPTRSRHLQAVACLKAGDADGYRAACAGIAKHLPPAGPRLSPADANTAAMAFALGPDATDDWAKPMAWIDYALARLAEAEKAKPERREEHSEARNRYLNTRGAVLYRAGRFEEAAKTLREGMALHPRGGEFHDWVFLALAEHRLGHADAARDAAARARAAQAGPKPDSVWAPAEVGLLAAELDAALPPSRK